MRVTKRKRVQGKLTYIGREDCLWKVEKGREQMRENIVVKD